MGVAGLLWSIGRDRRRNEKTGKTMPSVELADSVLAQPATREKSLKS
jgi:hypothetical protein